MPMYWDAYLADTTHLTTEEHGAYMLLLAAMWRRNGWVPDDDKDNARILGLTPAKWRKIKARLLTTISGFLVEDGMISQEKLLKTWKNTQEKIDKNRVNGSKGGRPKSSKNKDVAKADGSVSVNPNESIPEPEPEPYKIDDDSAGADLTFREKVLVAAGHDASGVTANGKIVGNGPDFMRFDKARRELSLSESDALKIVSETMQQKGDGPPSSLSYFVPPMQKIAGIRDAPAVSAIIPQQVNGAPRQRIRPDLNAIFATNPELNR